ncbi:MAG TPA: class I SAM-dependent methyltransferase [Capsulimonadaceae bacterium]|jgi:SAM-dependent methyltransferase
MTATTYDKQRTEMYEEYMQVPQETLDEFCRVLFDKTVADRPGSPLNILFMGIGSGRLEVPFLQYLLRQNFSHINVVACDASEDMISGLCDRVTKAFGIKIPTFATVRSDQSIKMAECDFCVDGTDTSIKIVIGDFTAKQTFAQIEGSFDLITAFFVLHLMGNWYVALSECMRMLRTSGHFAYTEEIGDARWVDGRFDDRETAIIESSTSADLDYRRALLRFYRRFHECRAKCQKPWDRDIIASDMRLVTEHLTRCWNTQPYAEGIATTTPATPSAEDIFWTAPGFSINQLIDWIRTGRAFYNPLFLSLSNQERLAIAEALDGQHYIIPKSQWDEVLPRQEGHRLTTFQKQGPYIGIEHTAYDSAYQLKRLHASSLYRLELPQQLGGPSLGDELRLSIANQVRRRLLWLYNHYFRSRRFVHLDYVIWEPDDYGMSTGDFAQNLPIYVAGLSQDCLADYLIDYTCYTNVRPSVPSQQHDGQAQELLFVDLIFDLTKFLGLIDIRRGERFNISVDVDDLGRLDRMTVVVPQHNASIELNNSISELHTILRNNYQHVYLRDENELTFDEIQRPWGRSYDAPHEIKSAIDAVRTVLTQEARQRVDVWRPDWMAVVGGTSEADHSLFHEKVELIVQSIVFMDMIGYSSQTAHWQRILFMPDVFAERQDGQSPSEKKRIGFSGLVVIDGMKQSTYAYDDAVRFAMSYFASQDAIVELSSLVAKESQANFDLQVKQSKLLNMFSRIMSDFTHTMTYIDKSRRHLHQFLAKERALGETSSPDIVSTINKALEKLEEHIGHRYAWLQKAVTPEKWTRSKIEGYQSINVYKEIAKFKSSRPFIQVLSHSFDLEEENWIYQDDWWSRFFDLSGLDRARRMNIRAAGQLGAFFTVLENVLSNTIKHNVRPSEGRNLLDKLADQDLAKELQSRCDLVSEADARDIRRRRYAELKLYVGNNDSGPTSKLPDTYPYELFDCAEQSTEWLWFRDNGIGMRPQDAEHAVRWLCGNQEALELEVGRGTGLALIGLCCQYMRWLPYLELGPVNERGYGSVTLWLRMAK